MSDLDIAAKEQAAANAWLQEWLEKYDYIDSIDDAFVDEIAFMFVDDHSRQMEWMRNAISDGWEWKATADDTVATWPIETSYEVRYDFLTKPDVAYRLELMRLRGFSPLHSSFIYNVEFNDSFGTVPIHASFKVNGDAEDYDSVLVALRGAGCIPALYCTSTYGKFSYWRVPEDKGGNEMRLYLKPRVNLRDAT